MKTTQEVQDLKRELRALVKSATTRDDIARGFAIRARLAKLGVSTASGLARSEG